MLSFCVFGGVLPERSGEPLHVDRSSQETSCFANFQVRQWSSGFPNLPFSPFLPFPPFSFLFLSPFSLFLILFTLFHLVSPFSLFTLFLFFHNFPIIFLHLLPFYLFSHPFSTKKTFSIPFPPFSGQSDASLCNFLASFCAVRGTSHTQDTEMNEARSEREFSLFLRIFLVQSDRGS